MESISLMETSYLQQEKKSQTASSSRGFNRFMPHKNSGGWISESRVACQMLGE
jgi:hypothetical protein